MNKYSKNSFPGYKFFNSIILPVILFILTYFIYGFYFETNDDFVISLLLNGNLQPQGGAFEIFYIHKFLIIIYTFLYGEINLLPWYGVFLCFFNLIATVNIFYLFHETFSKFFSRYIETLILTLLYFILIFENVALINFYKTAILLGGSSAIILIYIFLNNDNKKQIFYYILLLIFFAFAFFTRPPAAILALILILPFAFFILYRFKKLKQSVDLTFVVAIFVLSLLYTFAVTETTEQSEREKFNTSWINATEFNSAKQLDLSNKQDSIKKVALIYFFVGDKKAINNEYMERISTSKLFTFNKISLPRFKNALYNAATLILYIYPGITILNICLVFVLSIYYFRKKKNEFVIFLITQFLFFAFILFLDIFMKLPTRLFLPLYLIYTLCNFFQLKFIKPDYKNRKVLSYTLIILFISFAAFLYSFNEMTSSAKSKNEQNDEILNYINNKYSSKVFLFSQPACTLLDCLEPLKNDYFPNNKMLPIIGWTTIMPSYGEELTSITGSPQLNNLFYYIKQTNRNDFIIISDEEFIEFLQSYFKIIYDDELKFVQLPETPSVMKNRKLNLYTITK